MRINTIQQFHPFVAIVIIIWKNVPRQLATPSIYRRDASHEHYIWPFLGPAKLALLKLSYRPRTSDLSSLLLCMRLLTNPHEYNPIARLIATTKRSCSLSSNKKQPQIKLEI